MEIPPGETVSYAQISHSLGHPKAALAVARACASSRLAVLVPCHRVIRGSGDLAGYKWGIERKQKLLKKRSQGPMMLKIWFGKAGAMSLHDKQTSYRKIKALLGN